MTVSRAIKGSNHVSPETSERILRVVEELNYTVNTAARALATGQTGIIAVICGSPGPIYHANMVRLLDAELSASGYKMQLLNTKSEVRDLINATKVSAVDGVIASWMHDLSDEPHFRASQFFKRCVFLDTFEHPSSDYVRIDLRGAVQEALQHMINMGRKRIAYVGTSNDSNFDPATFNPAYAVEDRLRTYIATMRDAGRRVEYIDSYVQSPQPERIERLREYFQTHGCPDAILCLRDEIAILVYRALRDCGCRIPDDTLLVGCDGLPIMECFDPRLSAIVQPLERACALAWEFLQARIAAPGRPLQQTSLQATLALRGSMLPEGWIAPTPTKPAESEPSLHGDLSDEQWERIRSLLFARAGRKAQVNRRSILNAIFYVKRTGCQWRKLPPEYPNWSTVYSCYHRWEASGVLSAVYDAIEAGQNVREL